MRLTPSSVLSKSTYCLSCSTAFPLNPRTFAYALHRVLLEPLSSFLFSTSFPLIRLRAHCLQIPHHTPWTSVAGTHHKNNLTTCQVVFWFLPISPIRVPQRQCNLSFCSFIDPGLNTGLGTEQALRERVANSGIHEGFGQESVAQRC